MTNYDRGTAKLYDGTHSHINPIDATFGDNGAVKYVGLSDKGGRNILYLQGNMVEELYKQWKEKLGTFGPSEKDDVSGWRINQDGAVEFGRPVLHDVKLTTKQLELLHRILGP